MELPANENIIKFVLLVVVILAALGVLYYSVGMGGVYTMCITLLTIQWIQRLGDWK